MPLKNGVFYGRKHHFDILRLLHLAYFNRKLKKIAYFPHVLRMDRHQAIPDMAVKSL